MLVKEQSSDEWLMKAISLTFRMMFEMSFIKHFYFGQKVVDHFISLKYVDVSIPWQERLNVRHHSYKKDVKIKQ